MRLLIAGPARIRNKRIIAEPHKRRPVERLHGNGARRYVDLSHVLADGVVTYPGLPAVHVCDYLSREQSRDHSEQGTERQIAAIDLVDTNGTYLHLPFHRSSDRPHLPRVESTDRRRLGNKRGKN